MDEASAIDYRTCGHRPVHYHAAPHDISTVISIHSISSHFLFPDNYGQQVAAERPLQRVSTIRERGFLRVTDERRRRVWFPLRVPGEGLDALMPGPSFTPKGQRRSTALVAEQLSPGFCLARSDR